MVIVLNAEIFSYNNFTPYNVRLNVITKLEEHK